MVNDVALSLRGQQAIAGGDNDIVAYREQPRGTRRYERECRRQLLMRGGQVGFVSGIVSGSQWTFYGRSMAASTVERSAKEKKPLSMLICVGYARIAATLLGEEVSAIDLGRGLTHPRRQTGSRLDHHRHLAGVAARAQRFETPRIIDHGNRRGPVDPEHPKPR